MKDGSVRFFLPPEEVTSEMRRLEEKYGLEPQKFALEWLRYNLLHPKLWGKVAAVHLSDCKWKTSEYFRNGLLAQPWLAEMQKLNNWEAREEYGVKIVLGEYDSHEVLGDGALNGSDMAVLLAQLEEKNQGLMLLHELKNSVPVEPALQRQLAALKGEQMCIRDSIAGVWVPDKTRVGWWKNGYPRYFGKVINAPDFLSFDLYLNGQRFDLAKADLLSFYREVDMKTGVMSRKMTVRTPLGVVTIRSSRFFSCAQKELACMRYCIESQDFDGEVRLETGISADVFNTDANYGERFWNVESVLAKEEMLQPVSYTHLGPAAAHMIFTVKRK